MLNSERFGLPPVDYFQSKNIFTGSIKDFNYKITPKETMEAMVWFGKFCSEKSEIAAQKEFPLTQAGRDEMIAWLEKRYQIFLLK